LNIKHLFKTAEFQALRHARGFCGESFPLC